MARPPRLPVVFQEYNPPLYFVTFCTLERRACLNIKAVHEALVKYASAGIQKGAGVGRYVIMPDHVHVLADGKIARSGGRELAAEIEKDGYAFLK